MNKFEFKTLGDLRQFVKDMDQLPDDMNISFEDSDNNEYTISLTPESFGYEEVEDEEFEFGEIVEDEEPKKKLIFWVE